MTGSGTDGYTWDVRNRLVSTLSGASVKYEAFGRRTSKTIGGTTTTTYPYYYRARYYNPSLQRFISEDPLGYRGGINLYRYAADNPVNLTDPFGLTVTVNYWPSTGIPGTANFNYGHVSMSVDGTDGQAYISWMPANVGPTGTVPDDLLNATIAVGLAQDSGGEGRAPLQVAINGMNEKAILDWWKKYKRDPKFNIVGRNCATTVRDALTSGGAQLPFDNWPFPYNIYDYASDIRDLGLNGPLIKLAGSLE